MGIVQDTTCMWKTENKWGDECQGH